MSKDLFGIEEADDDVAQPYVIAQLIPADGWRVILEDEDGKPRMQGLACFALVELVTDTPDATPARMIRPMVATDDGQIDDVEAFDGFLCIVPPGGAAAQTVPKELQGMVDAARARRDASTH